MTMTKKETPERFVKIDGVWHERQWRWTGPRGQGSIAGMACTIRELSPYMQRYLDEEYGD